VDVEDFNSQRFQVALDLFGAGKTLTFNSTDFWLESESSLRVYVHSSWWIGNTDDGKALADLSRGESTLSYLISNSSEFAAIVHGRQPKYSLVHFDGRDAVELATFDGDKVNWI
jgi:hypothetical protein